MRWGEFTWIADLSENLFHFYLPINWLSLKMVTVQCSRISRWPMRSLVAVGSEEWAVKQGQGDGRAVRVEGGSGAWFWFPAWEGGRRHRSPLQGRIIGCCPDGLDFPHYWQLGYTGSPEEVEMYFFTFTFKWKFYRSTSEGFKTHRPMLRKTLGLHTTQASWIKLRSRVMILVAGCHFFSSVWRDLCSWMATSLPWNWRNCTKSGH